MVQSPMNANLSIQSGCLQLKQISSRNALRKKNEHNVISSPTRVENQAVWVGRVQLNHWMVE